MNMCFSMVVVRSGHLPQAISASGPGSTNRPG